MRTSSVSLILVPKRCRSPELALVASEIQVPMTCRDSRDAGILAIRPTENVHRPELGVVYCTVAEHRALVHASLYERRHTVAAKHLLP